MRRSSAPRDPSLFAITKVGKGIEDHIDDARVDAIHSIWVLTDRPEVVPGKKRWPIQGSFRRVLKLEQPVPKQDLIAAKLLKRQWPQSTNGQIFDGARLKEANPGMASVMRSECGKNFSFSWRGCA